MRWAQYLCALKYAMNVVLAIEFHESLKSCQGDAQLNCKNVLIGNDVNLNLLPMYVLLMFVLFITMRIIGGFLLVQRAKRFY